MLIDSPNINIEQSRHQFLNQPDGPLFYTNLYSLLTRLFGEHEELGCVIANLELFLAHNNLLQLAIERLM